MTCVIADAAEDVDAVEEDVVAEDDFDAEGDRGEAGAAPEVVAGVDDFIVFTFEGFSSFSVAGKIALIFLQISRASKPSC